MSTHKEYGVNGLAPIIEIGKAGAKLKNNAGVLESRNNADADFAIMRGATPVDANDLVTKAYLEAYGAPVVIGNIYDNTGPDSAQFTGAGQEGFLAICNETTGSFTVDYIYRLDTWDTDVATSTWTEIVPTEGMTFVNANASSGGVDSYTADHIYLWDADAPAGWVDVGPAAASTYIDKNLTANPVIADADVAQDFTGGTIPLGARVTGWEMTVTEAWVSGTMELGHASDPDEFATPDEIDLTIVGIYTGKCYYVTEGVTTPQYVVTGSGGATGAASITLHYSIS